MEHNQVTANDGAIKSKANIALVVFMLIGAYFVVTEHWAHLSTLFPYWPYLLLFACPLMHVFMHGGHGHGGHASSDAAKGPTKDKS